MTFLIAVVMAIFAGVKAMIVAGCGQVYVLEARIVIGITTSTPRVSSRRILTCVRVHLQLSGHNGAATC